MSPLERWKHNPFFVLGLAPDAGELEIERHGKRLLAELELGLRSARLVLTPFGPLERTRERVRDALAELREPDRRARHARWAGLPGGVPGAIEPPASAAATAPDQSCAPWPEAMSFFGWRSV